MIFTALSLAPTVPSEPKPQNLQLIVSSGVISSFSVSGKEVLETSSTIPIVKLSFGFLSARFSNTDMMCEGRVSFEPNP